MPTSFNITPHLFLATISVFFSCSSCSCSKQRNVYQSGIESYQRGHYTQAIEDFKLSLAENSAKDSAHYYMAKSIIEIENHSQDSASRQHRDSPSIRNYAWLLKLDSPLAEDSSLVQAMLEALEAWFYSSGFKTKLLENATGICFSLKGDFAVLVQDATIKIYDPHNALSTPIAFKPPFGQPYEAVLTNNDRAIVALYSDSDIHVIRSDGTSGFQLRDDYGQLYGSLSATNDGTFFFTDGFDQLWKMTIHQEQKNYIMKEDFFGDISVSADGSTIVFARKEGNAKSIFTMKPDGTDIKRITAEGTNYITPGISSDASKLAYCADYGYSNRKLLLKDLSTGAETELYSYNPSGKGGILNNPRFFDNNTKLSYDLYSGSTLIVDLVRKWDKEEMQSFVRNRLPGLLLYKSE